MKIKSLIYEDQSTDWKLEQIDFKPLTLLVGVSGVGKTQILKALVNLRKISRGESINGLNWNIEFSTSAGYEYKWCGEFENKGFISEILSEMVGDDEKDRPFIENEKLFINNELIVDRNRDGIIFNKNKTVKLSQKESVISLLKEEEQIKDIYENFKKIIFDDNTGNNFQFARFGLTDEVKSKSKKYKSLKSIRNSDENIKTKLCLLHRNQKKLFQEIVDSFVDIFPYVEDIRMETIKDDRRELPIFLSDSLFVHVKEKNVSHWIDEFKMSSGMLRTLMHIAELYLCADDTVILIDEFENSLGINCINQITGSIVASERNLQFIITSHHPYIINDIGFSHWKIVTRKGGKVKAIDADQFPLDKSKHKAFTQLANLTEYTEGIES